MLSPGRNPQQAPNREQIIEDYQNWVRAGRPQPQKGKSNLEMRTINSVNGYNELETFMLMDRNFSPEDAYKRASATSNKVGMSNEDAGDFEARRQTRERREAGEMPWATPDGRLRPGWKMVNGKPVPIGAGDRNEIQRLLLDQQSTKAKPQAPVVQNGLAQLLGGVTR
jgi:hypothetical protein